MKTKIRIHPDVILSVVSLVFVAIMWIECSGYPADVQLFPKLFGGCFAAFSVAILIKGIRRSILKTKDPDAVPESDWWIKLKTLKYPMITVGMIILYMVLVSVVGIYAASIIYSIAAMRYFGEKRLVVLLGVSIGMQVFLYLLMEVALAVTLPRGILFEALFR